MSADFFSKIVKSWLIEVTRREACRKLVGRARTREVIDIHFVTPSLTLFTI